MYVFTVYLLFVCWPLSSPDGSYTEEQNSETQVKAKIDPTSTTPEFDDEFDDEEVMPTIGTCKALYPFEGSSRLAQHIWPDGKYFKLRVTCLSAASAALIHGADVCECRVEERDSTQ